MASDDETTATVRANLRLLLKYDKKHNATTLSREVLGRGKDYLNDFLTEKGGFFRKSSLAHKELVKIVNYYKLRPYELINDKLTEVEAEHIASLVGNPIEQENRQLNPQEHFDVYREGGASYDEKRDTPFIESFDPDVPDDADHEGRIRIIAETEDSPSHRPHDAINELLSLGGLGSGEEVELAWVRDGDGHKQVDAIRDDYWRFPTSFLQRELRRAASQLIIIECQGDSMEPTIVSGARVMVDVRHVHPSPDGIYAIRDRFGAIRIKRLQVALSGEPMVRVICDNPSHPQEAMPLADLVVIGRVVGVIRTF